MSTIPSPPSLLRRVYLAALRWRITGRLEASLSEARNRRVWHKQPLSVLLLYVFGGALAIWNTHVPSPGEAVAALAVAAAVMTLLGEMRGVEKVAWILILFGFLGVELASIKIERVTREAEQSSAHLEQLKHFQAIGDAISTSVEQSNRNFAATLNRTNQVLTNVTGGESFAYISPQNFNPDAFPGVVWNNGEQALTGLTLTIAHTTEPPALWGSSLFQPIFIGTIGPHEYAPVPNFLFQPKADPKTGQDNYWIFLSAQNGTVSQSLYFRRDHNHPNMWAYSFTVSKQTISEKPQAQRLMVKGKPIQFPHRVTTYKLLLYRDWSDDLADIAAKADELAKKKSKQLR